MKKIIHAPEAPAPIGPYSQAVKTGNLLFVSGQIAIDQLQGTFITEDIEKETRQVMTNLQRILAASGCDFSHVVKCSIFLKSMDDFVKVNAIYGEFFDVDPPARETVEVSRLPKNVNVEISCIAYIPS